MDALKLAGALYDECGLVRQRLREPEVRFGELTLSEDAEAEAADRFSVEPHGYGDCALAGRCMSCLCPGIPPDVGHKGGLARGDDPSDEAEAHLARRRRHAPDVRLSAIVRETLRGGGECLAAR